MKTLTQMIIPIYTSNGGGGKVQDLLSLLIVIDFALIVWFLIDYLVNRKRLEFKYFMWDNDLISVPIIRSVAFCLLNGMALLLWLSSIVEKFLN